ncbi:hypothetical protein L218DRAFT_885797, partial [Marasmius fiardii PR-910]
LTEGGRIWWISREARRLMGQLTNARYNSIVAIIYVPLLQSTATTAIYSCLVADVTLVWAVDPDAHGLIPFDFGPVTGLAPTLIIVRVAYGKSVNNVQQMVTLQLTGSAHGNSQDSRPAVDLQP